MVTLPTLTKWSPNSEGAYQQPDPRGGWAGDFESFPDVLMEMTSQRQQ
jgi:hypothetical protein